MIGSYLAQGILVLSCICLVVQVHWVAGTSRCSLLPKFGLCDCFRNMTRIVGLMSTWKHLVVVAAALGRIEKLCCHHHLLLLILASIWCLSLVYQVEEMSLVRSCVLMANSTRSSYSVVTNAACPRSKSARGIPLSLINHLAHIVLSLIHILLESSDNSSMAGIALPQFGHKVSIEHCLSHLNLLLG